MPTTLIQQSQHQHRSSHGGPYAYEKKTFQLEPNPTRDAKKPSSAVLTRTCYTRSAFACGALVVASPARGSPPSQLQTVWSRLEWRFLVSSSHTPLLTPRRPKLPCFCETVPDCLSLGLLPHQRESATVQGPATRPGQGLCQRALTPAAWAPNPR